MDTEHDLGSLKGSFSIALDFVLAFFEWGEEISDEKKKIKIKSAMIQEHLAVSLWKLGTADCYKSV